MTSVSAALLSAIPRREIVRLLGATCLAFASLAACAATMTIDGPSVVDSRVSISAQYTATVHWDDGTTTNVTANSGWSSSNYTQAQARSNGQVVFGTLGTVTIYASYITTVSMSVSYVAGTSGPWSAPLLDCPTEVAGPLPVSQLGELYTGPASDFVPLCNGRLLMSNTGLNRLQLLDIHTGQLEGSLDLPSTPTRLRRIAGTPIVIAALSSGSIARVDLATGSISFAPIGNKIQDIERGQPGRSWC